MPAIFVGAIIIIAILQSETAISYKCNTEGFCSDWITEECTELFAVYRGTVLLCQPTRRTVLSVILYQPR